MKIELIKKACIEIFPVSRVQEFLPFFTEVFEYAGITTEQGAAMFIGQVGVECDGFTRFEENLNYKPERLVQVWPSRFRMPRTMSIPQSNVLADDPNAEIFKDGKRNPYKFAHQPQKLANYVYGSREGNRGPESGDGWRFRGRGLKQLTFANNYLAFTNDTKSFLKTDFIKKPDAILIPKNAVYSAGWFWIENNLNQFADKAVPDNIGLTKKVNGGTLKLKERIAITQKTLKLIAK